jgi:hypothetical protein
MYDDLLGEKKKKSPRPPRKHYNLVKDEVNEDALEEIKKNWNDLPPSQDISC